MRNPAIILITSGILIFCYGIYDVLTQQARNTGRIADQIEHEHRLKQQQDRIAHEHRLMDLENERVKLSIEAQSARRLAEIEAKYDAEEKAANHRTEAHLMKREAEANLKAAQEEAYKSRGL